MPRGAPDYSNVKVDKPVHRVTDLAELAARLYSPVTYDRAGNVMWLTGFEHGIAVLKTSVVGTGASQAATAETAVSGAFGLKMTTSNLSNQVQSATRSVYVPNPDARMGLEAGFAILYDNVELGISIIEYDGTDSYEYSLTYREDEQRLYVTTPTSSGTLKSDFTIRQGIASWHVMKIIADFEDNVYIRAQFDSEIFDISDQAGWHQASTEEARIDIRLKGASRENDNKVIYWDNIIVTQNEP